MFEEVEFDERAKREVLMQVREKDNRARRPYYVHSPEAKAMMISNKEVIESGRADEFTPPLDYCEFCGAELVTYGIPFAKLGVDHPSAGEIFWKGDYRNYGSRYRHVPEECKCKDAKMMHETMINLQEEDRKKIERSTAELKLKQWKQKLYENSELGVSFPEHMRFDTYDVGDLPEDPRRWSTIQIAKQLSIHYAEHYREKIEAEDGTSRGKGLLYTGGSGTGKTHLAIATLRSLTEAGVSTLAIRTSDLLSRLRDSYNDVSGERQRELLDRFTGVDVLLIDDLDKSKPTEWTLEKLFYILDVRMSKSRPTFVTSNCTDRELVQNLTPERSGDDKTARAIVSRLKSGCKWVQMNGSDYRARDWR